MARIACLLLPDLPVAALCRADPDRAGKPLVLTDVPGAHARVVAASPEARALGVRPGHHTAAQARAHATRLIVCRRDPAAETSARGALVDVATSLADRIEQAPAGAALIRAARGEDERPLAPQSFALAVEEAVALEYAIDTVEPLLFALHGLVLRAIERIGLAGTGCVELGLALDLDDRSRDARTIPLVAPTRD